MQTTAKEIIKRAKENRPELRLAVSATGGAIGVWHEPMGRFVMVAGRMIGNYSTMDGSEGDIPAEWRDMPYELLINGKPPVSDWVEVE